MVSKTQLKVGDEVIVPWGLDEDVPGRIVEVWGNPPTHVRVEVNLGEDDHPVLLLSPDIVERVA